MANGDRSPSDPEEYVLRSGVRSGLKREFAFALKVQAELLPFSLSRTRSGVKRSKRSDSAGDPLPPQETPGSPPAESAAEALVVVEEAVVADAAPPENGSSVDDPIEVGDRDEERKMGSASSLPKPIIWYSRKGTPERLTTAASAASLPPLIEPVMPVESLVETQMSVDESCAPKSDIGPVENGFAAEDPIVIDGHDGPLAPEKPLRRFTSSALKVPEEQAGATPPPSTFGDGSSMKTPMLVEDNSLEKSDRRYAMGALKSSLMEPVDETLMAADGSLPEKPIRRFTRSTTKVSGSGDVGTTNSGSDGSVETKGGSDTANGSLSSTPNKKMELKMSKKIALTKMPGNVRDLLGTGLLDGLPVKYMLPNKKLILLHGVIKGNNILCSCASCNWSKAVSAYNFELHAGSTKKHPSDFIFLENGKSLRDILRGCTRTPLDMLESAIQKAIGPAPPNKAVSCQKCKESFSTSRIGKFALLCDSCLDSKLPPTTPSPSHGTASSKRLSKAVSVSGSLDSSAKNLSSNKKTSVGKLTRKDLGLHKLVFMNDILPEGTEVGYYVRGKRLLEGYIKDNGIFCRCCNTVVSPSQFEAHAGRCSRRKPYNNIYTSNGVSLHELSVSLSKGRKLSTSENDDLCSICADGGDLLLCDLCPRAFHQECVGLSSIPRGDWYCQYCQNLHQRERSVANNDNAKAAGRVDGVDPIEQIIKRCIRIATTSDIDVGGCALCRRHHFSKSTFDDHTVLLCDQCEREYHVGCLKEHNMADLKELPEGEWFCCTDCHKIHNVLQDLLLHGAEPLPILDANIIKEKRERKGLDKDADVVISWRLLSGKTAEGDSKLLLSKAVAIFHESFDPIVDVTTGRDLIPSMVYGRTVRDQDYGGMYCAVLTVGSCVVSAGILRILGSEVAELPLVATTRESQGLGYFQTLFSCIERLLASLDVKHFVLPAAEEAESIWTKKFGFTKITAEQLQNYLKGARTTVFQGTSTLHKPVGQAQGNKGSC